MWGTPASVAVPSSCPADTWTSGTGGSTHSQRLLSSLPSLQVCSSCLRQLLALPPPGLPVCPVPRHFLVSLPGAALYPPLLLVCTSLSFTSLSCFLSGRAGGAGLFSDNTGGTCLAGQSGRLVGWEGQIGGSCSVASGSSPCTRPGLGGQGLHP